MPYWWSFSRWYQAHLIDCNWSSVDIKNIPVPNVSIWEHMPWQRYQIGFSGYECFLYGIFNYGFTVSLSQHRQRLKMSKHIFLLSFFEPRYNCHTWFYILGLNHFQSRSWTWKGLLINMPKVWKHSHIYILKSHGKQPKVLKWHTKEIICVWPNIVLL